MSADLDALLTLDEAAAMLAGSDPAAHGRRYESLRKAAQRGRLAVRLVPSRGGGTYVTTPEAVADYVAQVEAWRAAGRVPRNRRRSPDRLTRREVEELIP